MTLVDDSGPEDFEHWVREATGWDGKQFSLTEDERHWITRANETIEWLRLYAHVGNQEFLDSALRSLNGLRPLPGSLTIE